MIAESEYPAYPVLAMSMVAIRDAGDGLDRNADCIGHFPSPQAHRLPFYNAGVSRVRLPFELFKLKIS